MSNKQLTDLIKEYEEAQAIRELINRKEPVSKHVKLGDLWYIEDERTLYVCAGFIDKKPRWVKVNDVDKNDT